MVRELIYFSTETTWEYTTPSPSEVTWVDPAELVQSVMNDLIRSRYLRNMAEGFREAGLTSHIERHEGYSRESLQAAYQTAQKIDKLLPHGGGLAWLNHIDSSMDLDQHQGL